MASTMADVSKLLTNVCNLTFLAVAMLFLAGLRATDGDGLDRNDVVGPPDAGRGLPDTHKLQFRPNVNPNVIPNDGVPLQREGVPGMPNQFNPPLGNNAIPNRNQLPGEGNQQQLYVDNPLLPKSKKYDAALGQSRKKSPSLISDRISTSLECKGEYERICPKTSKMNNFAVLECLQNANKETGTKLSQECDQHLWNYKKNLTEDARFKEAATTVCRKVTVCQKESKDGAILLSCLIEKIKEIDDTHCRQFVNRMEVITFSDYRLIRGFYDKCSESVVKLKCGSVQQDNQPTHLQGETIQCLESKIGEVKADCKAAILRVAELSADDYHKDRALYFACRDDRERYCEKELAGDGRIYKCLEKHKKEKMMSNECVEALTIRQKLISVDVKIDKQLLKNCRNSIKERSCFPQEGTTEVTLSSLLLCLEEEPEEDEKFFPLSGECQAELFSIRKSLMEDFKVNPEIVTSCMDDIENYCRGLRREGKTLHCLMERAMKKKLEDDCYEAVHDLLKEVKAGSDYRLDPILASSCEKSQGALCSKIKSGDSQVLSCLMDNIESDLMEDKCATKLYELQYFISRDFKLDTNLHRSCRKDASRFCHFVGKNMDGENFACLHNHLHDKNEALSTDCATQVHRALRQRASMVSLNPSIEKKCRSDLGQFCQAGKNEFACLQENYNDLSKECQAVIKSFTQEESEDVRMNKALMKACSPMLKRYCQESLKRKVDEGDALECLISHKNDDEMDPKCAAGIEHFQIIQLKDFTLSFKFKQACKDDVKKFCADALNKKKDTILACLSASIRAASLLSKQHNISESCRAQVKFEKLQESDDMQLQPELYNACKMDLDNFCAYRTKTNADSLECLRKFDDKISPECYKKLFKKERELQEKPEWDYFLMKICDRFIKTTCKSSKDSLMECLQNHMHDATMEQGCKDAISQRMEEEAKDYRLNPTMKRVCFIDMGKFCSNIRKDARDDRNVDLQGSMMTCLEKHLEENEKKLSPLCEKYVRHFMVETALNFELDPQVKRACTSEAKKLCADQITQHGEGLVVECLKDALKNNKMNDPGCRTQIIKLTSEGLTDIQVDPQLAMACRLDLKHYCHGVMRGQGQQMACLLEALEDQTVRLQKECKKMLEERKELWEFAAEVVPPETFNELYLQISHSSSRNHFFMSFLSFIAGVLFFGVCCGRATKRLPAGVKNK